MNGNFVTEKHKSEIKNSMDRFKRRLDRGENRISEVKNTQTKKKIRIKHKRQKCENIKRVRDIENTVRRLNIHS